MLSETEIPALLGQGRLQEVNHVVSQLIRQHPGRADLRARLFQVLCVQGLWDRASTQLQLAVDLGNASEELLLSVPVMASLLEAEKVRHLVFRGEGSPIVFGEPPAWMARQAEGVRLAGSGQMGAAAGLFRGVLEEVEATAGTLDQAPFEWVLDADARFGPMLEMILHGTYYWVPFRSLSRIVLTPAADLHERVWRQATLTLSNGAEVNAFLPARYPGTIETSDGSLMLGRETAWSPIGGGLFLGAGQRFLSTDTAEHPISRITEVRLASAGKPSDPGA